VGRKRGEIVGRGGWSKLLGKGWGKPKRFQVRKEKGWFGWVNRNRILELPVLFKPILIVPCTSFHPSSPLRSAVDLELWPEISELEKG
jgi:hypothetical protein